jgi:hypothetical protein
MAVAVRRQRRSDRLLSINYRQMNVRLFVFFAAIKGFVILLSCISLIALSLLVTTGWLLVLINNTKNFILRHNSEIQKY